MGDSTPIQWTDATWNPLAGCSVVSPGCTNCYAMKMAHRIEGMHAALGRATHYAGLTRKTKAGAVWTGKLAAAPDHILTLPTRWKKPRRVFVNSMSDLFHGGVTDEAIDKVFAIMALAQQHTFQVLTKRSDRMRDYVNGDWRQRVRPWLDKLKPSSLWNGNIVNAWGFLNEGKLPNVWLGVSVEDQERAEKRIPDLLATPAAVRFLSCEPLLGPVDLRAVRWGHANALTGLDWVIIGGESGPGSRPLHLSWAASLVEQCRIAGVWAYMKQLGAEAYDDLSYVGSSPRYETKDRKGGDMDEWPTSLRVREFPT